jgi:hypothetical protein
MERGGHGGGGEGVKNLRLMAKALFMQREPRRAEKMAKKVDGRLTKATTKATTRMSR